jgi:hypothetical protein
MTIKTSRDPDYFGDIEKYGKFGEDLFLDMYEDKLEIDDVRDNISYQRRDVDFIVKKKGIEGRWYCIEVKVDTRTLDTGNLAYEVISHDANGWSVITQADFVFMVLAEDTEKLKPVKSLLIDMNKWKEYCSNRLTPKRLNVIQSEGIVDLLCKITDLKKYGVIVKTLDMGLWK